MKRLMLCFLFFAFAFQTMFANDNYYDVVINGIYYKLNNDSKEATVTMGCNEIDESGYNNPVIVVSYAGDVVIPESFSYNGISYTVTSIEGQVRNLNHFYSYGAFEYCKDLTSITIPKTIKTIGHQAFNKCTSLQSVYISDLTAWCNICFDLYDRYGNYFPNANPLFFAHDLYLNGSKMSDLVIPEEVVTIKEGAFIGSSISSVVFHKNVTGIGYKAFDSCNSLTDVYSYSPRLTSRESFVEHTNKKLHIRERYYESYIRPYDSSEWKLFGEIKYIEGVDYNLVYVVDDAEYKKTLVEVGETITPEPEPTKEGYTFSGWSEIPETMPNHDVTVKGSFSPNTYKLTYFVDGELYKVVTVKCDETITAEPDPTKKGMTFSGWSEIPDKMPAKDIRVTGTFSWSKITINKIIYQVTDTINNNAAVIGNNEVNGGVTIASDVEFDYNYKVTSIANKAFNGCKDVTSIEIPATITNIGERAFAKIDKLTDVTITAEDVPTTDRTAFENSYIDYVTLHVPAGSVERYKATGPWKVFKEIVAIEGTEPISVETCVMPTISFQDGKLEFESETDGAECHYEIKVEDAKEGVGSEVSLSSAYEISVYASKEGYNDSEKNSATLYWINVDPNSTGVIENEMRVNTNAILVQNAGGVIAISGVADGENVLVYNISGQLIAQGNVSGNHVEIGTKLSSGDICIIKIADKTVKYLLK